MSATTADTTPEAAPAGPRTRPHPDALLGFAAAAAFALVGFATTALVSDAPTTANTWTEIVLVVLAAGAGAAVLLAGARARAWGAPALAAFAAVVALNFASLAWSVQPAFSWLAANLTLSYLAAFALAMALARLVPQRWPALVGAVAMYALVITVYALLTKVFPTAFDRGDAIGRLRAPFDYYNATGVVAGMGAPAWLWLGAARRGSARSELALSALSVPALALVVCALILSFGRGALAATLVGVAVWFTFVPARLRGALVLACGAGGGTFLGLWASAHHSISEDYIALSARVSAGHTFGIVLVIGLVVLGGVGVAVGQGLQRLGLSRLTRRRIGTALLVAVALVPLGGIVALALSSRGLTGQISHAWSSLTSPHAGVGDTPGRLVALGSSRPLYWGDALKVGAHAPLAGTGAFGFAVACPRYSRGCPANAHSYVLQTFADLGAVGLIVSAVLLIAWALAVRRTLRAGGGAAERAGLITLLAVAVIFGLHSAIDWTWFFPGVALPALACAGWLAGRGPLPAAVGRLPQIRRPTGAPLRAGAAAGVCALALLAAWVLWLPLRAQNAWSAATSALVRGDAGAALSEARTAAASNPLDIAPRELLSVIYSDLGETALARKELVNATSLQPSNPDSWTALAQFDAAHGRPADAARELARARALAPYA